MRERLTAVRKRREKKKRGKKKTWSLALFCFPELKKTKKKLREGVGQTGKKEVDEEKRAKSKTSERRQPLLASYGLPIRADNPRTSERSRRKN